MPHFMIVFLLLVAPQTPPSLSPSEFVDRVSSTYGRLNSFSADFEQISEELSNHRGVQRGRTKENSTNSEETPGGQQSSQAGKEHEA